MSLTTLSAVKAYLNVPDSNVSQDNWLDALRVGAEAVVKERVGRNLESQNYVEYYSGTSQRNIVLRQRPVTQVNNVWLDYQANFGQFPGSFPTSSLLINGTDYVLDYDQGGTQSRSGILWRLHTVWAEIGREYYPGKLSAEIGPLYGNVKVDYVGGFVTIPDDLQYAVAYLVAWMKRNIPFGGVLGAERIGQYSYELMNYRHLNYPELATVDQVLGRYKEFSIGYL